MKNDYKKKDFYVKKDGDGNVYYFMKINGTYIEVAHEVFNVFYVSYKKQLRDIQKDINYKLMSLDNKLNDNMKYVDMIVDEVDHYEQIKINDEGLLSLPVTHVLLKQYINVLSS